MPTTPKGELVKEWLNTHSLSHRNVPAGSDGQHASFNEENVVQPDNGQDNEMNYMLNKIISPMKLDPPPVKKNKNAVKTTIAEVHENKPFKDINFYSGDYATIASDAPGASTSGGSKQFVQMDSIHAVPKASPNLDKMTQFCSSPKTFTTQDNEEMVISTQQKDSSAQSSETPPYIENNESDSPPYLENEQLLTESDVNRHPSTTGKVPCASTPSVLLSSYASESSSASFQGEGYVSEDKAALLTTGSYQMNHNVTSGFATPFADKEVSTCKDGQYVSQTALDNMISTGNAVLQQDASHKKSPKGSSSVDSYCIDCYDNSPVDV